jgi:hypothetical protein
MATLTVRNVDAGVKERLRVRAARHGRSGASRYCYINTTFMVILGERFSAKWTEWGSNVVGSLAFITRVSISHEQRGKRSATVDYLAVFSFEPLRRPKISAEDKMSLADN